MGFWAAKREEEKKLGWAKEKRKKKLLNKRERKEQDHLKIKSFQSQINFILGVTDRHDLEKFISTRSGHGQSRPTCFTRINS